MTPAADAAAQTTGASVMRGGAWAALGHIVPQLYVVAISIAGARFLGPSDFGRQSFIAFVSLSVLLVLTSGIGLALMRTVAEALGRDRPDEAIGVVGWAWRLQLVGAVLGAGGLLIAAGLGARPEAAWAFAAAFVAFGVLQSVANAVLLGTQHFRSAALIGAVTGGVMVPLIIGVLAAGGGITGMFAVEAAVAGANLVWTWVLARRALHGPSAPAVELRRGALRFAGWTTLSALVTLVVWRRSEFLFLAHYSTDAQIGLYSIAFAMVTAVSAIPEQLSTVFVSAFATLRGADAADRVRSGFARALRLIVLATLPITAGAAAVGPELLKVVYGDVYEGAGTPLLIMVGVIPFLAIGSIASSLMSGYDDARTPLLAGAFAAVVNIALALLLIPPLDATGAALANSGAQIAATVPLYVAARRLSGPVRWEVGSLLRCGVASAGCALAALGMIALVGGAAGVTLGIAAGTATFAALALGLRVLAADDAAWLDGHLGQAFGGRAGVLLRRAAA
jgi:O-antigen/teichoic acid export membrane protein